LKPHGAKKDFLTRFMDKVFGPFFKRFNRGFERAGNAYSRSTTTIVRRTGIALVVYGGLIGLTYLGFNAVPAGSFPTRTSSTSLRSRSCRRQPRLTARTRSIRKIGEIGLKQRVSRMRCSSAACQSTASHELERGHRVFPAR